MGVLRPSQMLGESYRVVRELGAGGMGVVYEIEHVRLKKRYVAKVIHEHIRGEEGAAKRMEREAQVLAGISHRNVVQVHDIGTTPEGASYFVMEKLEGIDLRSMMKRQAVPQLRAIEIMVDVLDALDYVHRRGIVHRDIKPENIFLAEEGHGTATKVLDFGIVHIFDGDGRISQGRITKTGGFVGTLYYAAPEQMQGQAAAPANDVYATGLVLFELIAGQGPFDDDPGVGLSRCFKPAPRLTDIAPRTPPELSDVVAKALAQDPAHRPPAAALASELRAVSAALRSQPEAAADDALRAEIDDLLRRIPPVDLAPRSPGKPTATPGSPPVVVVDSSKQTSSSDGVAFDATLASANDAPQTAPMPALGAGATPRGPSLDTSPGVYSTVDGPKVDGAPAKRGRWTIAASATLLLLSFGAVAWILGRPVSNTPVSAPAAASALPAPSTSASGIGSARPPTTH